jgi:ABC-type nitrate/sulfonate/bicarbonate transport system substrate-binding protein
MRRLTGLLAAVLLLAACGDDGGDSGGANGGGEDLTAVTLMLNWTPNNHHAGIYAAQELGLYEEAGLDVEIVEPATTGVEQVVADGDAEFGIAQAESLLPARAAGVPVVSIATLLPHNDSSLMALGETGIARPRDLEGHTYGGYGGALETELINRLVECDGGDPDQVEFVEVGNVDYLAGMEDGRFDFVWVFNGWDALRAETVDDAEITTIPFLDHTDCIPDWYTPILLTSEGMIDEDPEVVEAFLDATAAGYRVAIEDPAEAASLLLDAVPELDQALVEASADYHTGRYAEDGEPWGVQDGRIWAEFATFLQEAGLLEEPVATEPAFTNDFLPDEPSPPPGE